MATNANISAVLKRVFANDYQRMVDPDAKFYRLLKYSEKTRTGDDYYMPVFLTRSNGQSFFSSTNARSPQNLAVSNATVSQGASVKGSEFRHREQILEASVLASLSDKQAFVNTWTAIYESAMKGILYSIEEMFITGGVGRGVTTTSRPSTVLGVSESSTLTNMNIDPAYWSPAYWAGMEGLTVSFYTNTVAGSGTIVSSAADAVFTVQLVDMDNKQVQFLGTSTGTTALKTASSSALYIFRSGLDSSNNLLSSFNNTCTGIHAMFTTTGSVFGISNTTYSRWKPVNYAVGSVPLNFGKVTDAVAKINNRWGVSGNVKMFVSPTTWNNINIDEAAARVYDSSYSKSKVDVGTEGITYHGATGEISIISHPLVWDGFAYGLYGTDDQNVWTRVGDTDITNKVPGVGEIVTKVPGTNYFEMQLIANLAPFCSRLGDQMILTGITNS